jgi:beta-D-xylosidase 4
MHLEAAIEQGLTNESVVDKAVVRQYSSLIRLGYFDDASKQPYRALNWSAVDTKKSRDLAYKAAVEGVTMLKNDGIFPLNLREGSSIAVVGDWANATRKMQGNYLGRAPYLITPVMAFEKIPGVTVHHAFGVGGTDPRTDEWTPAIEAAKKSDVVFFVSGVDNEQEAEGKDRNHISWSPAQIDLAQHLAALGKPMAILQMGGGSLDSSWIKDDDRIGGLIWGGYPGQSGGEALVDIMLGKVAPAGYVSSCFGLIHNTVHSPLLTYLQSSCHHPIPRGVRWSGVYARLLYASISW